MSQPAADPVTPAACPDCRSDQMKGPDQPGTGLSYWRCLKCGLVWNPERPPERNGSRQPERSTHRSSSSYWQNK